MVSEMRRAATIALALAVLLAWTVGPAAPAGAEHEGAAAERAAREILDARDRANDAAQAMFDAESRLDSLTIELAQAEEDLAALEAEVGELRRGVADSAVRQFVGAGRDSLLLFQDIGQTNELATAQVYTSAASGSQLVQVDDYDQAIDELDDARHALEQKRADTADAADAWAALKADAEQQVLELQRIEQERLADAEVQHELERQRQARAEQERREREQEAERQAAANAAAQAAAASGGGSSTSSGSSSGGSDQGGGGGQGGGSGSGASQQPVAPPAPTPPSNAGSGMVCPVAGPRSFADTWGAPRSGGRSHEGVDMMAPGGTPLVAVESGSATFKTNNLGGNAVWITGSSGTKYYYAHLSAWEGSSRSVSQGEVIGYVGATGNTSVNHLHFEVHPFGGRAVNPYPYVRAVC
jgi:murein DD-endopeptidase MepM/ murein hydrolase activator NlpD